MTCPECKATRLAKSGLTWRNRQRIQRWRCLSCGRIFSDPINSDNPQKKVTSDNSEKPLSKTGGETRSDYLGHGKAPNNARKPSKSAT